MPRACQNWEIYVEKWVNDTTNLDEALLTHFATNKAIPVKNSPHYLEQKCRFYDNRVTWAIYWVKTTKNESRKYKYIF